MADKLAGDPENALGNIKALQAQYGQATPQVWKDLVTQGRLPAAYEAVGTLDPENATLLARGLGEVRLKKDGTPGKTWPDLIGKTPASDIQKAIVGDSDAQAFRTSLERQYGMTATRIDEVMSSMETLAYARQVYRGDPSAAATAVKAFTSKYDFGMPGGPRVPSANYPAVAANGGQILGARTPQNTFIPPDFAEPGPAQAGRPEPQVYLDLLRAKPMWVNAPGSDALLLMDSKGRLVRDETYQPITLPFSAAMPADAGVDTTMSVPY